MDLSWGRRRPVPPDDLDGLSAHDAAPPVGGVAGAGTARGPVGAGVSGTAGATGGSVPGKALTVPEPGAMVVVIGASGGLGASTLAAALADSWATAVPGRRVPGTDLASVLAIDGDVTAGGLDVTLCLDHRPGARWPEVSRWGPDPRSEDVAELFAQLPRRRALAVLAAGSGPVPTVATQRTVVEAARYGGSRVVLDLPASEAVDRHWAREVALVVLVGGCEPRHLADLRRVAEQVAPWPCPLGVVVRGPDRTVAALGEAIATDVGVPMLATWADRPALVDDAAAGRPPRARRGNGLVPVCHAVTRAATRAPADLAPADPGQRRVRTRRAGADTGVGDADVGEITVPPRRPRPGRAA